MSADSTSHVRNDARDINVIWYLSLTKYSLHTARPNYKTHPENSILRDNLTLSIKLTRLMFLTFMGPCIIIIFQYISNKMQRYTVYLYLETALHVSCGTSAHHQERIQLYLQHLVFVTPLLLPAPIAAGSSNSVTNVRCCRYSCMHS